jgi:hypothetical protein
MILARSEKSEIWKRKTREIKGRNREQKIILGTIPPKLHLPIRNKIDLIIRAAKIMIYLLFLEKRKRRRHDSGTAGDIRIHPN